jgi:isoleucyl-tRNA synthetase
MAVSLKDSLNLPITQYPMRASLATREPERLRDWDNQNLYQRIIETHRDDTPFILHDGPPYANGNIHMGHTLNKVLKDIVVRYKSMRGHCAPYVPGWDCHGLPIEQQVLKQVGDKIHDMDPVELRKLCHTYALEWIDIQRDQFKRLGILADWETPYTTVNPGYEVGILTVLHKLVEKGLVRKGFKTVHWDTVFRTALAEAEIEYHSHQSPSIYVAMPLIDPSVIPELKDFDSVSIVIWTTTPWTMPANLGVSLHPEFPYVAVQAEDNRVFIVAKGMLESFISHCQLENSKVVAEFSAKPLENGLCRHPIFEDRTSLIMLGEHVTLEQGTGCVHTAPGHGADDFIIGRQYGLPVFCPVDPKGCYTDEYPEMAGIQVFDANPRIVEKLRESGLLLAHKMIRHEYPFSWRSKQPIIFRATAQWFMELAEGGVREKALQAIDQSVQWIPSWGQDRIRGMVERRPEWCLSRQRHWGVPIPALRSIKTGESILDAGIIAKFIEMVKTKGTDAWYSEPISSFLPDGFVYEPTGESSPDDFEKEFDILDVWFDSGASHQAVLEQDPRLHFPADLYLEGSDQHRGWFQSSLLTAIGSRDEAPFKAVLTHGFVLDGAGKAMSKSMGNVISPLDLIEEFGADILRLWVASLDYRNDVAISKEIIKITADSYRSIRNTLRFQLGNLHDFDYDRDAVPVAQLTPLDRWALHELATLVPQVTEAYETYEFHKVYQLINRFYAVTLSAKYHDFCKDRLYTMRADSEDRRSAQTVIHHMFHTLNRLLAPILVFTTDEAHRYAQGDSDFSGTAIHLESWPQIPDEWSCAEVASDVEQLLDLRDKVNERMESLRVEKIIGKSVDAAIDITASADHPLYQLCLRYQSSLPELFIVSQVNLSDTGETAEFSINARKAEGVRCPRCWRWVPVLVQTPAGEVCERCADALALHV